MARKPHRLPSLPQLLDEIARLRQIVRHLRDSRHSVYTERNRAAAAFARLCQASGYTVGLGEDPYAEDDYRTVLFIDLPTGQVTWHIGAHDLPLVSGLPPYPHPFDGHSTAEKERRLETCAFAPSFPTVTFSANATTGALPFPATTTAGGWS